MRTAIGLSALAILGTQTPQHPDIRGIELAAVTAAAQSFRGANLLLAPARGAMNEARPSEENSALAGALGGRLADGTLALGCQAKNATKSSCHLSTGQQLVWIVIAKAVGDSAFVDVVRVEPDRRTGIHRSAITMLITRSGNGWTVVRRALSAS